MDHHSCHVFKSEFDILTCSCPGLVSLGQAKEVCCGDEVMLVEQELEVNFFVCLWLDP